MDKVGRDMSVISMPMLIGIKGIFIGSTGEERRGSPKQESGMAAAGWVVARRGGGSCWCLGGDRWKLDGGR